MPFRPSAEFFFAFLVTQRTSVIVKGLEREVMSCSGRQGICLLMGEVEVGLEE